MSTYTEQDIEAMAAEHQRIDAEYRASLTAEQLREYRLWCQEIVELCPACGQVDAELIHDSGPDMIGSWWTTECASCHTLIDAGGDGPEAVR